MRLKIDWASLILGRKFYYRFSLFLTEFPSTSPPAGLNLEGQFNGGFFALGAWGRGGLYLEGLIHGGAYFRNFTVV